MLLVTRSIAEAVCDEDATGGGLNRIRYAWFIALRTNQTVQEATIGPMLEGKDLFAQVRLVSSSHISMVGRLVQFIGSEHN